MPKLPQKPRTENLVEIKPIAPVVVPQTRSLYRLTPVGEDLAQPHRQIALVAAETEQDARLLASVHDPFGRPWGDERKYTSDTTQSGELHVVGDVVFKSIPAPPIVKSKGKT